MGSPKQGKQYSNNKLFKRGGQIPLCDISTFGIILMLICCVVLLAMLMGYKALSV
jgi:hypothetical protein